MLLWLNIGSAHFERASYETEGKKLYSGMSQSISE